MSQKILNISYLSIKILAFFKFLPSCVSTKLVKHFSVVLFKNFISVRPFSLKKTPSYRSISNLHDKKFANEIYEQNFFLASSSFHVMLKVRVLSCFF